MALRTLLHSHGASAAEDMHMGELDVGNLLEEGAIHENTLDLRIASVFVILFGAVLFGLPTLVLKQFQSADAPVPRLLRAFAGGVVLALALVHIIPEAVGDLNSLIEYPVGGCTILFGIIILVVIDSSLAAYLTPATNKQQILSQSQSTHHGTHTADASKKSLYSKDSCPTKDAELVVVRSNPDSPMIGAGHHHDLEADINSSTEDFDASPPAHQHQCLKGLNSSAAAPVKHVKQFVTAYTMELGCIFHSVIIGVGVGVITDDRHLVVTLMLALAIHQGLEALALGSVLAMTSFSRAKKFGMLMLYSITTPLGIALGIAISSRYDPESTTSKAVQGTLNGISGGMLLYIGMYQLIAEEFSRQDLVAQPKLRLGMYGSLCMGAALMCVLAVWS